MDNPSKYSASKLSVTDRLIPCVLAAGLAMGSTTANAATLVVAYAGSMGRLMDHYIGPRFAAANHEQYQGIGRGAFGLARMLKSGQLHADVFLAITRGPVRILQRAKLVQQAQAFAATQMVMAWSRRSSRTKQFAVSKADHAPWYKVLETPGIRFGRTDPLTDPQGRASLLCLQLAAKYYHQPPLATRITGPVENPAQIFTEASLMFRLRAGQIDACLTYQSAARAAHVPYVVLPPEINLGDPQFQSQYAAARLVVRSGRGKRLRFRGHPLIFYCVTLKNSHHPRLSAAFMRYLHSPTVRPWMRACGYTPVMMTVR